VPTTKGLQRVATSKPCLLSRRAARVGAGDAAPSTATRKYTSIKIRDVIFALIFNVNGSQKDEIRRYSAVVPLLMGSNTRTGHGVVQNVKSAPAEANM
jgi:hypothetical protein